MAVEVFIPTALRQYADGNDMAELEAGKLSDILEALVTKYPNLREQLFRNGELRTFVNIFVEDDNMRDLDGLDSTVADGDEVSIVPAVAGGVLGSTEGVEISNEEIQRYARHLILPEVGMEGQKKLKAASILLIGAGGLGSPLGMYLAAAGIGRLGLVDYDVVDHSNLQRQIIHGTEDVGKLKIESAKETIQSINPNVQVDLYPVGITSENALEIVEPYDIVIDGTDNFPTRYLVNDACVLLGKPNVYGSIYRFEGQASVFNYEGGPCYRSLYPEPPDPSMVPSCAEAGVLGILPGLIGMIQATEAIKIILGQGTSLSGRLMLIDTMRMKFREMKIKKNPNVNITELIDYVQFCGMPDAEHSPTAQAEEESQSDWDITVEQLKEMMDKGEEFQLLDTREPHEAKICGLGGQLIPKAELQHTLMELDQDEHYVVHCRTGGRSAQAVDLMRNLGFENVWNVRGGMHAWADRIDTSVPKY